MMKLQILAQALLLCGELEKPQRQLLEVLCASAESALTARLREGLTPEDCKADFVAGASLYALAALDDCAQDPEQVRIGDITLRNPGKNKAAGCLRSQAELIMAPYLRDRFSFQRV